MTTAFNFKDTYKLQGLRKKLVTLLQSKYAFDGEILNAIAKIPRHFFLESAFAEQAYHDKAFPIGDGQTISQPYTVAYQTQFAEIKKKDKVLEIGTGSGYQCAVLCEMGAKVFSIERIESLHKKAKHILTHLGYSPKLYLADGTLGLVRHQPFDVILVTAGAPVVPESLVSQLADGGRLIIPVGDKENQEMLRIIKTEKGIKKEILDSFRFVPLIGKEGF